MRTNSNVNLRYCTQVLCLLIALVAVSLTVTPAGAQDIDAGWNALGPDGGLSGSVIVHPANPAQLFTYGGADGRLLYYSENRGESWERISELGYIRFFLIEPVAPYRLFAGLDKGILFSPGPGEPWLPFAVNLTSMAYISDMYAAPTAPGRFYAKSGRQAYRSDDDGATWEPIGSDNFSIFELIVSPLDADLLFIRAGNRLLRSEDGGRSWHELGPNQFSIQSLVASPFDRETLYRSAWPPNSSVSKDAGMTWEPLDVGQGEFVLHPTDDQTLYFIATTGRINNLFVSEDGGLNWRVLQTGLTATRAIDSLTIDPTNPSVWYAGASVDYEQNALYRSNDAGLSWQPINDGIRALTVEQFAYSADQSLLYALTESRLFWRSTDVDSWNQVESPPSFYYSSRLAVDPAQNERLFLLTDGRLFRANGRSEPWLEIWPSSATQPIKEFIAVPTTPTTLVATTGMSRVWVSRNNGEGWQQTLDQQSENATWPCSPTTSFAYDPANPLTLYFFSDGELFRSRTGGASWQEIASFSPNRPDNPFTWCPTPLAVEAETGAVWLGAGQEIWRSRDEGVTWQAIPTARFDGVRAIRLASARPGTAAVLDGDRILITQNDGVNWLVFAEEGSSAYPLQIELGPDPMAALTVSFSNRGLFTRTVEIEALYLPLLRHE